MAALFRPGRALWKTPTLREKGKLQRKEKLRIAAAAARLVSEGQVVMIREPTTQIARALRWPAGLCADIPSQILASCVWDS
jgi:DeoR/GlpR family transcriptional regulator of sugar metabolism